jgi:hypothetical protein
VCARSSSPTSCAPSRATSSTRSTTSTSPTSRWSRSSASSRRTASHCSTWTSCRPTADRCAGTPAVDELREREQDLGVETIEWYQSFAERVQRTKRDLLRFLIDARDRGEQVVGYGAPGKGNTLLNYCGIRTDLLEYTVDRNPHKQGRFLPGTHIPIHHPSQLAETQPDYVLIMPWNLRDEIAAQLSYVNDWGGRLVVAIPELEILNSGRGGGRR